MRRARRDDSGVMAVLIAILVSCVLLGMAAIAIDVGSLFAERRELQNGADAAALAVARSCLDPSGCVTSKAQTYANANAKDGTSALDPSHGAAVCGNFTGLPSCSAPTGSALDCAPLPPSTLKYVQVRTSTLRSGGSTLMPPIFARAILGNSGYAGKTVHACSRAAAANASGGSGFAVTVSQCEWDKATAGGTLFVTPPPWPPNPTATSEVNLRLHDGGAKKSDYPCPPGTSSGADLPGGFGWLSDSGNCQTTVDTDGTYSAGPGVSISDVCKNALAAAITNHTVLYLPVYDSLTGTGANGTYSLSGFAAFVPTGYNLPGAGPPNKVKSWLSNSFCYDKIDGKTSTKCLSGVFTKGLIKNGESGGPGGSLPGVYALTPLR